jgi:hypothetical protein
VLAAIDRDGRLLSGADPDQARSVDQRLRSDWRDFLAWRQRLDAPALLVSKQLDRAKWGW